MAGWAAIAFKAGVREPCLARRRTLAGLPDRDHLGPVEPAEDETAQAGESGRAGRYNAGCPRWPDTLRGAPLLTRSRPRGPTTGAELRQRHSHAKATSSRSGPVGVRLKRRNRFADRARQSTAAPVQGPGSVGEQNSDLRDTLRGTGPGVRRYRISSLSSVSGRVHPPVEVWVAGGRSPSSSHSGARRGASRCCRPAEVAPQDALAPVRAGPLRPWSPGRPRPPARGRADWHADEHAACFAALGTFTQTELCTAS